jgi:hypothetical protein
MNCTESEKLMLLEESGELDGALREALLSHLGSCATCRRIQAENTLLLDAASHMPVSSGAPAAILDAIHLAAERHTLRQPQSLSIPWRGIIAAAASITLCLAGLRLLTTHPASPRLAVNHAATEIVPLVALVMGSDGLQDNYFGESEIAVLADQLLLLQGMRLDAREDVLDDFTSLEDSQPTTLQWNSNHESLPERCG